MAMILMNSHVRKDYFSQYKYLVDFADAMGFFIYQNSDTRTLMHRDIIGYKNGKFIEHELTYNAYLRNGIFVTEGIIIPNSEIKGRLKDISLESGLLNDLRDFIEYAC